MMLFLFCFCSVLQLMDVVDSRLAQRRCEKLDLALLSFIEHFRKIYIGEQVQRTSKVKRLTHLYLRYLYSKI